MISFEYDALVYLGLGGILAVTAVAAWVLVRVGKEAVDLETRKVRFAAATFTGILMLLVFTATLYFVDESPRGKEIFDKTIGALTPIAGAIIGYFFSSRGRGEKSE